MAGEAKRRILDFTSLFLAFTSLFPFHLMIIYITFVHTSLYVMVLQVEKICVLDLPGRGCVLYKQTLMKILFFIR